MTLATNNNSTLAEIPRCEFFIPGRTDSIKFVSLPEITDSKQTTYNNEIIMGRAFPAKIFSHSDDRSISLRFSLYVVASGDEVKNLQIVRAFQSTLYPRNGVNGLPFRPPPICWFRCGEIITRRAPTVRIGIGKDEQDERGKPRGAECVIVKSVSVTYPTDVPWSNDEYLCPHKIDVSVEMDVVYSSLNLPGHERILSGF